MKRTKHSLSHYKLLTTDMGYLTPVSCFHVLPGDSVQQATSLLLRVNPLAAPVMHPVQIRVHHWFVPYRLVWKHNGTDGGWEEFITGGSDGEGDGAVFPTWTDTVTMGQLLDHLGVPLGVSITGNALPLRAYQLIWNEFYRDQQLQTPAVISTAGGADSTTSKVLQRVNWEKDYLTTARVDPQLGPEVTLPLGTSATVGKTGDGIPSFIKVGDSVVRNLATSGGANDVFVTGAGAGDATLEWDNPKLYADLSTATAVDVNTVRMAFALQRYQEARNMYGSRYTEYLRYLGIRPSDARLQRPEYLGGGKQTIAFTEVLQTGVTTSGSASGVGNLKGHGIAALRSRRYRRFFEEHGVVLSLLSVRPKSMYTDALHREWTKTTKEDFYQRELEHVGMQEVYKQEGRAADGTASFGWQDRYAEYRHLPSTVSGEFRDSTMNFWHLSRAFGSAISLNSDFIACEPDTRIYQASLANNNLWIMANHSIQARRMVGRGNMPGRII